MIDPTHALPIVRQAQLLELSRSSVYYRPQPTSDADLALMRRIDELHLEHPFAAARTAASTGGRRKTHTSTCRRSRRRLNPAEHPLKFRQFCPAAWGHLYEPTPPEFVIVVATGPDDRQL